LEKVPGNLAKSVSPWDFLKTGEGMMAGEERIATLDVSPDCLVEFAAIITKLCKVVGSAHCGTAIRLQVMVPAEFGSRVQVTATKTEGSVHFQLVSMP
jgi:hypothetical protein